MKTTLAIVCSLLLAWTPVLAQAPAACVGARRPRLLPLRQGVLCRASFPGVAACPCDSGSSFALKSTFDLGTRWLDLDFTSNTGADVIKRIAASMVGGIITSTISVLAVYPVIYYLWRSRQVETARQEGRNEQRIEPA